MKRVEPSHGLFEKYNRRKRERGKQKSVTSWGPTQRAQSKRNLLQLRGMPAFPELHQVWDSQSKISKTAKPSDTAKPVHQNILRWKANLKAIESRPRRQNVWPFGPLGLGPWLSTAFVGVSLWTSLSRWQSSGTSGALAAACRRSGEI